METRIVDFHPDVVWTQALTSQVDELVAWYNGGGERMLTVNFWIAADTERAMTHMTWVIMRLRMEKHHQLGDPRFCIAASKPLADGALDLISGLDSRMPRLLFMPQAVDDADFADPTALLTKYAGGLDHRMLTRRALMLCNKPHRQLPLLIAALDSGKDALDTPCIEVPYGADIADPGALCGLLARLWQVCPALTETLGMMQDGYVKRFYQLKELWHLTLLDGGGLTAADAAAHLGAHADSAQSAALSAFDTAFLDRHASAANYVSWRATRASSVLEFDLDSIADSHECQSPVFLNGQWLVDRSQLSYADAQQESAS